MTDKEAIEILNNWSPWQEIGDYDRFRDALEMAIKSLEQQLILDKIRAEIREEMLSHNGTGEEVIQAYADGLKKGLRIIDKYTAESEDKK